MNTPQAILAAALAGIVLSCLALPLPSGAQPPATAGRAPASKPASRPGWTLVWADEFDYEGLPDPARWTYETGFVRNGEKQYYTQGRAENARVTGGHLIIEGRKERYAVADAARGRPRGFADYTSASITTEGKASWTYGRVEVRAKLPRGRGVWPAAWMLGTNRSTVGWPRCGEIDIMEFVGHTPDKIHGTIHYGPAGKHASRGGNLTVKEPWNDFHVYAMEWNASEISIFFDNRRYFTFPVSAAAGADGSNAFARPQYLLLNLALGGSWGGVIDDSVLPQQYVVDYVRVYQRAAAASRPAKGS